MDLIFILAVFVVPIVLLPIGVVGYIVFDKIVDAIQHTARPYKPTNHS